ncbi:ABC transporter permease [Arthrobacter bambusae]|uniref:ABC transporter permease n=1 Tax=Arthrobacter bambusae TaxID=1338426 RepID=UPI00278337C2|nr:FtsX-like permease family protein [Arthrobacter bambusae]MDQ0209924.1 putative ABC transport system permease protein [Arthrobacter bambusae]MDQ0237788.1 putative ABC transport system permease protein [Arthrobacter bambusae]
MSVLARSVGNAFRNKIRTAAVVAVLAVAIGLALAMLVANQAVGGKVQELNASVGTVLTVNPAGAQGFDGGGEPLTTAQTATAAAVPNVVSVVGTKALRLETATAAATSTTGTTTQQAGPGGGGPGGGTSVTTNLQAAIDAGTLGTRNNASSSTGSGSTGTGNTGTAPAFSLPITATGIGAEVDTSGKALNITSGTGLGDYTVASTKALVGTTLATKNNLKAGSTFTIAGKTFTVAGIFDAGTTFGNNAVYTTLAEAQALAATPGELSSMVVTVNSMDNVDAAKTALQNALGTSKADVTQGQRNLQTAVSSLDSVKNISLVAFIAALGTAGLIILLIMVMLVRERRREIGVLKAIGARNRTIGLQFVLEALVLVALGSVVGAAIASFASGGIASALISSNSSTSTASQRGPGGGGFGGPGGNPFGGASQLLTSVTASASPGVIAAGVAAVFGVAVVGALVPALLTARIRPIEVLRGE